jgi:hypothetical protein
MDVCAKCSDACWAKLNNKEHDGYVPRGVGLGNDEDYVEMTFCLDCGQIQGRWPVKDPKLNGGIS